MYWQALKLERARILNGLDADRAAEAILHSLLTEQDLAPETLFQLTRMLVFELDPSLARSALARVERDAAARSEDVDVLTAALLQREQERAPIPDGLLAESIAMLAP